MVCPYHGWAFDAEGKVRDVPASENKVTPVSVEEKPRHSTASWGALPPWRTAGCTHPMLLCIHTHYMHTHTLLLQMVCHNLQLRSFLVSICSFPYHLVSALQGRLVEAAGGVSMRSGREGRRVWRFPTKNP